jgi:TetR/AcrR family transcriptional repressor of nem operon
LHDDRHLILIELMTRYDESHKARSRVSLVEAAAGLFRRRGYSGVGINELCAAAGLTRGAFYGHFDSKAELLTAVLEGAHDLVRRLKSRTARSTNGLRRQGAGVARDYLAPENRQAVIGGCSLSALAVDVARSNPQTQRAYARAVRSVVAELRRGEAGERLSADRARVVLALCVGGLLIDNACGRDPEGARVARAAQAEVSRLMGS